MKCIPSSRASAITCSRGSPVKNASSPRSAASSLPEAAARGLDAFVTGEPREHTMGEAAEYGVHFLAAGHYATETFGVRRLGELLERELGLEHHWGPLDNPV